MAWNHKMFYGPLKVAFVTFIDAKMFWPTSKKIRRYKYLPLILPTTLSLIRIFIFKTMEKFYHFWAEEKQVEEAQAAVEQEKKDVAEEQEKLKKTKEGEAAAIEEEKKAEKAAVAKVEEQKNKAVLDASNSHSRTLTKIQTCVCDERKMRQN